MQAKETTLIKMLSGTKVFLVPLFQRRYKWSGDDWRELWDDILEQYDHPDVGAGSMREGEGHFLGSLVLHPAPGPASTVTRYLVVDGQQRLTTLLILISVLRDARSREDAGWNPQAYDNQFLTNPYNAEHFQRLVPTIRDREAFHKTVFEGEPTGQPGRAYTFYTKALRALAQRDGHIDFDRLEITVLLRLLVVDITTSPGDNVNHIFHTLNHAGQKLSPLDLVRNRMFMSLDDEVLEAAYTELWQPMEVQLGDAEAQRYLWAQVARFDPKATQKDLYPAYERRLQRQSESFGRGNTSQAVEEELRRLHRETVLYAAIVRPPSLEALAHGSPGEEELPAAVVMRLRDLMAWGSSTHVPLTLEILSRFQNGQADESEVLQALDHTLSFMIRRALCAIPTNNLNRIFTSLPSTLGSEPIGQRLAELLSAENRYWPSDEEVIERSASTPIYATAQPAQVKFILERLEWAASSHEYVDTSGLQVEHILPQRPGREWHQYLSSLGDIPEETYTRTNTLGNLTLSGWNQELSRRVFDQKRKIYADSLVGLTKQLASYDEWTQSAILERGRGLAELACQVWMRPRTSPDLSQEIEQERIGLSELLTRFPEESWTTAEVLSEYFATSIDEITYQLNQLDSVLAVKVLAPDGGLPLDDLGPERRNELVRQLEDSSYSLDPPIYEAVAPLSLAELRALESRSEDPDADLQ